ncbi:MAG: hypothetical protein WBE78_18145, partial [Candidatus Binataceae bacterium]
AFSPLLFSARSTDVFEEILDQHFHTAKVITLLAGSNVPVVAFSGLVIVPDNHSLDRLVVKPVFETVRPLGRRPREFSQHHFANGAIRVHEPGAENQRCA